MVVHTHSAQNIDRKSGEDRLYFSFSEELTKEDLCFGIEEQTVSVNN